MRLATFSSWFLFFGTALEPRSQSAVLCAEPLAVGDQLEFVGLARSNTDTAVSQEVKVSEISCINIPQANVPRFRAMNEEIAKFDEVINRNVGGVFIDAKGRVRALWASYSFYSWSADKVGKLQALFFFFAELCLIYQCSP